MIRLPALVVHCDWSKDERKRWMACASLENGRYRAESPEPVGEPGSLIARLRGRSNGAIAESAAGSILVGFDFPVGLPAAYAERAGIGDFRAFLVGLENGEWPQFYSVCTDAAQIELERPFYPNKTGGTRRSQLCDGLGLTSPQLYRRCELSQAGRGAACPLFWTLGGNQAGKSSISGWKHVIGPAVAAGEAAIWPFAGTLQQLLHPGSLVLAESYPTHYHQRLFGAQFAGKRLRSRRKAVGEAWLRCAAEWQIDLDPELRTMIGAGFPKPGDATDEAEARSDSEDDRFDAAVGLFGMIDTLQQYGPRFEPVDDAITKIEGWILGQDAV